MWRSELAAGKILTRSREQGDGPMQMWVHRHVCSKQWAQLGCIQAVERSQFRQEFCVGAPVQVGPRCV